MSTGVLLITQTLLQHCPCETFLAAVRKRQAIVQMPSMQFAKLAFKRHDYIGFTDLTDLKAGLTGPM